MKKENINKKTIIANKTVSYYKRVHYCTLENEIAINFNYGEYRKIQLQTLKKLKYLFWSNLREELTRWRKKIY